MLARELSSRMNEVEADSGFLLFSLPLGKRGISSRNRSNEHRWGVNLLDKKLVRVSLDTSEYAVSKFDFRWRRDEHFCVQYPPHFPGPLHSLLSEQRWIEPRKLNASNIGLYTFTYTERSNPRSGAFVRRTEEPFQLGTAVTTTDCRNVALPTPANDDCPPSEAEAA